MSRLKSEGKLESTEPSEEIKDAYIDKSRNSLLAAELLSKAKLPEESVSMAYYSMYHILTALLFSTGIKCENHSAAIALLKILFGRQDLYGQIRKAKEERIDKQYYTDFSSTQKDAEQLIQNAQAFTHAVKQLIISQTSEGRKKAKELIESL